MSEQLVLNEPAGTISVPAATLTGIVAQAAELVDGARVRRPRRGIDVDVNGSRANVTVRLAARYGAVLPQLGEGVQEQVAEALERMCGLRVRAVDVAIEELV
jgi:uncharacterized alkaline shock family protein YloU